MRYIYTFTVAIYATIAAALTVIEETTTNPGIYSINARRFTPEPKTAESIEGSRIFPRHGDDTYLSFNKRYRSGPCTDAETEAACQAISPICTGANSYPNGVYQYGQCECICYYPPGPAPPSSNPHVTVGPSCTPEDTPGRVYNCSGANPQPVNPAGYSPPPADPTPGPSPPSPGPYPGPYPGPISDPFAGCYPEGSCI